MDYKAKYEKYKQKYLSKLDKSNKISYVRKKHWLFVFPEVIEQIIKIISEILLDV